MSRSHQRDEADDGLCGVVLAAGDFDGDGDTEVILGPRGYSKRPVLIAPAAQLRERGAVDAQPLQISGAPAGRDSGVWSGARLTAFDFDGDGRLDLVAAVSDNEGYYIPAGADRIAKDQRDRYHDDGRWKGAASTWSLHLLRNAGTQGGPLEFEYSATVVLPASPPGGPLAAV
ncbi:MAG: VCBS repeat-containing protein, partial [Planctomycetota bacterium]|nr:VCBS repeat-containing protein [Planctomycetota bacterium]